MYNSTLAALLHVLQLTSAMCLGRISYSRPIATVRECSDEIHEVDPRRGHPTAHLWHAYERYVTLCILHVSVGGASVVSENEYEVVEPGSNPTLSGSVRAMRESLLHELRRDISKLMSLGGNAQGGESGRSGGKSVKVRPGLALGVITLQAGARGPKLTLQ